MKKILFVLLICLFLFGLVGCGDSEDPRKYDKFFKENAVEVDLNNNIKFKETTYQYDEYLRDIPYAKKGKDCYNIFTHKPTPYNYVPRIITIGGINLYRFPSEMYLYDAFCEKTILKNPIDVSKWQQKYLLIGNSSSLYKNVTDNKPVEKDAIECLTAYVYDNVSEGKYYYIICSPDDTHVLARNIISRSYENGLSKYLFDKITKINDTYYYGIEIINGIKERKFYDVKFNEALENSVSVDQVCFDETEHKDEEENDEKYYYAYTFGFGLVKNQKYMPFEFYQARVDDITNDYTYVLSFKDTFVHYKTKLVFNGKEIEDPGFYPLEYKLSKDRSYAYILCQKVLKDRTLSNENYVMKVDTRRFRENYSKNVSLFNEDKAYNYLKYGKEYYKYENKELEFANSDFALFTSNVESNKWLIGIKHNGDFEFTNLTSENMYELITTKNYNNTAWLYCYTGSYPFIKSISYNNEEDKINNINYTNINIINRDECCFFDRDNNTLFYHGEIVNVKCTENSSVSMYKIRILGQVRKFLYVRDFENKLIEVTDYVETKNKNN